MIYLQLPVYLHQVKSDYLMNLKPDVQKHQNSSQHHLTPGSAPRFDSSCGNHPSGASLQVYGNSIVSETLCRCVSASFMLKFLKIHTLW